jgi:sugar lactone lactonase YvrE
MQVDKEIYRQIIERYFRAFGTGDFSQVQFSPTIQFLSPISGITMDGPLAVQNFVNGVSTRVTAVNILSTTVEYPTASGVWQMTTTKGITYTLHNFFRLNEEGLGYIWPMFDPKAVMQDPTSLLQWLTGKGYYEVAGTVQQQPTGVAISQTDRIFVNFPRHAQIPSPSVGELRDGALIPYPDAQMNAWDGQPGDSARRCFVCAHTVHVDAGDTLWILDPANPGHAGVVPGGAKLVKVDLATNLVSRIYTFDGDVAPAGSYLNKVRIARGHAFITDSDLGALVVLDLETGKARRVLESEPCTKAEPGVSLAIDGQLVKFPPVHADGIAIDPGFEHVYFKALIGRTIYRVAVSALLEPTLSPADLGRRVETVAISEPTGGMEFDSQGNLYLTGVQEDAIKVLRPNGHIEFFARAVDFLWPDTIAISRAGDLVFTASQLHLMPGYNDGVDRRTPPYKIFRLKLQSLRRESLSQETPA